MNYPNVLLLNKCYTPLNVISFQEAMTLLTKGKARWEHHVNNKFVRTVNKTYDYPSIIVLNTYVNRPFRKVPVNRRNVFIRDNYTCQYCGKVMHPVKDRHELTLDHIHPSSQGGKFSWTNLVTSCKSCNSLKGDKSIDHMVENFGWEYPVAYKPSFIIFANNKYKNESWKKYLYMS